MALLASARAAALVAALFAAGPAHAAAADGQVWSTVQATAPLSAKTFLTLEGQTRLTDDVSQLGQLVVRPSVSWRLDDTKTAALGYAYVRITPLGRSQVHEHRTWQQVSFRIAGDGKGPTFVGRTRLEQRWVEDNDSAGWRLRQQVRLTAPIKDRLRGVAWTEVFIGLNETDWGQQDGVRVWRSFLGASLPVSHMLTVEPGYLHQRAFRRGEDAVTHAAAISLTLQY